jgi:predicted permease
MGLVLMAALSSIFFNNLFPIILIAAVGYAAAKWLHVRPGDVSSVVFYIFSPCLVFDLLVASDLQIAAVVEMLVFALIVCLGVGGLTWIVGRLFIRERKLLAAVVLSTTFMNAGALGMPLIEFTFGEETLAYAALFFVAMLILTYTLGVGIASLGSYDLKKTFLELARNPALYAVIGAFLFMGWGWELPAPLEKTISTLGSAAIPTMLVLLGIQLFHIKRTLHVGPLLFASGMRLGGGIAVGLLVSLLFGLDPAARQAGIIEAAMPTAIVATVLATEYDLKADLVTSIVFVTTLLSPVTLTPLLLLLQ